MKKGFLLGVLAVFFLGLVSPGLAKVKIGGIIFTDFYYLDRDRANAAFSGEGNDPYTVTTLQVPDITRLYATWTNEDNVGMYVELGMGQERGAVDQNQSNTVMLRHAYGWWDLNDSFRIMAGKSTTPFSPLNPSQLLGTRSGSLNIVGVGYGNFYSTSNKILGFDLDSKSRMWGFSVPIDLSKRFRIRPEVMWYDDGELKIKDVGNIDNGKYAIYGVQFQVTF